MTNHDDLLALSKEVENSNAVRVSGRLETLYINFFVFDRNYQELMKIIMGVKSTEQMLRLWDLRNRNELDMVTNEVVRLLHNFLASAKSLVAHTRVVITDWYQETDFFKEYEAQVSSRFVNNSLIGFIEELRNFSLHYSLPITNATLSVQFDQDQRDSTHNFSFVLHKPSLIHWSGWTRKAKPYLDTSKDDIEIDSLVEDYHKQILDFHSWMESRLRAIHSDDLAWLTEMQERMISLMSEDERRDRGFTK